MIGKIDKLHFFTRYGTKGASSRLRFLQFIPWLQQHGWEVETSEFYSNDYLDKLYVSRRHSKVEFVRAWWRRLQQLRRSACDRIPAVIEYELLAYMPFFMEQWYLNRHRYILNYDDAVYLRYNSIPPLRTKFARLAAGADGIIVANDLLRDYFSHYNGNVIKIPTVPPEYPSTLLPEYPELTLVWIGTPVTYNYLLERRHVLRKAYDIHPFRLLVIAAEHLPGIDGIPATIVNWSEKSEYELISRAHIGLMPLPNTNFAAGKSAYKLIQYLRCHIPAIASPVGENLQVLKNGETGFFADNDSDFLRAFSRLADPAERERMRPFIRREAEKYSFRQAGNQLLDFINAAFTGKTEQ